MGERTLTFSATLPVATLRVSISVDVIFEFFFVDLMVIGESIPMLTVTNNRARIIIVNDDCKSHTCSESMKSSITTFLVVILGFTSPEVSVIEGVDEIVTVSFGVLDGVLGRSVPLQIFTSPASAGGTTFRDSDIICASMTHTHFFNCAAGDYVTATTTAILSQSRTLLDVSVTILDDDVLEEQEYFFLMALVDDEEQETFLTNISNTTTGNDGLLGSFLANVTISDDDSKE